MTGPGTGASARAVIGAAVIGAVGTLLASYITVRGGKVSVPGLTGTVTVTHGTTFTHTETASATATVTRTETVTKTTSESGSGQSATSGELSALEFCQLAKSRYCVDPPKATTVANTLFRYQIVGNGIFDNWETLVDGSNLRCDSIRLEFGTQDSPYNDGVPAARMRITTDSGTLVEAKAGAGEIGTLETDRIARKPFLLESSGSPSYNTLVKGTATCEG